MRPTDHLRPTIWLAAAVGLTATVGASTMARATGPSSISPSAVVTTSTTTTAATATNTAATPTTIAATSTTAASIEDHVFVGDGWSMTIPSTWQFVADMPAPPLPIRSQYAWTTGPATLTFGSNVNVLVEPLASPMSLDDYLNLNVVNVEQGLDAEIIDSTMLDVPDGSTLGRIEYAFTATEPLKALAVLMAVDGGFAVATFVAPAEGFDAEVIAIEPVLQTLAPSALPPTVTTTSTTIV